MNNSVFISYRRSASAYIALAVYQHLESRGIDVFLDIESLDSGGPFPNIIRNQIASRPYFMPILTPGSLERCTDPDDWVRREIEHALNINRRFLPLYTPEFTFSDIERFLPKHIADKLQPYNAIQIPFLQFRLVMDNICQQKLTSIEVELTPVPRADKEAILRKQKRVAAEPAVTEKQRTAQEYFERALKHGDNLDSAISDFDEAIRSNPQFAEAYHKRGKAREAKGDLDEAIADYQKALESGPQLVEARESLAEAYYKHGKARKAKENFETGAEPPRIGVPALRAVAPAENIDVFFRAYYPHEVQVKVRHSLYVYAHVEAAIAAIEKDINKFKEELGDVPVPKVAKQSARLQPGTLITIAPECDELAFDPPSLAKKWDEQWVRFDFDFKPPLSTSGDTLTVRVSVMVNGFEIANIKFAMEAVEGVSPNRYPLTHKTIKPTAMTDSANPTISDNRPVAAKLTSASTQMYQQIFISYSRADTEVTEAYRLAQLAVGNDVFMDTYSIRAGENWRAALANAIDSADVFQLFWSDNSAQSLNVHDEWQYALKYRCPYTKCEGFIRAVFWKRPLPTPPSELSHLNFRYVPLSVNGGQGETRSQPSVSPENKSVKKGCDISVRLVVVLSAILIVLIGGIGLYMANRPTPTLDKTQTLVAANATQSASALVPSLTNTMDIVATNTPITAASATWTSVIPTDTFTPTQAPTVTATSTALPTKPPLPSPTTSATPTLTSIPSTATSTRTETYTPQPSATWPNVVPTKPSLATPTVKLSSSFPQEFTFTSLNGKPIVVIAVYVEGACFTPTSAQGCQPVWIDYQPVTYQDYSLCQSIYGCTISAFNGFLDTPIVGINWSSASSYCAWRNQGRLPTEREWTIAVTNLHINVQDIHEWSYTDGHGQNIAGIPPNVVTLSPKTKEVIPANTIREDLGFRCVFTQKP